MVLGSMAWTDWVLVGSIVAWYAGPLLWRDWRDYCRDKKKEGEWRMMNDETRFGVGDGEAKGERVMTTEWLQTDDGEKVREARLAELETLLSDCDGVLEMCSALFVELGPHVDNTTMPFDITANIIPSLAKFRGRISTTLTNAKPEVPSDTHDTAWRASMTTSKGSETGRTSDGNRMVENA